MNFDDFFEEEELLGKGTYGIVIKGTTKSSYTKVPPGFDVAVKLIKLGRLVDIDTIKDIKREIDILKKVSSPPPTGTGCNPGIVCYYDSFVVNYEGKKYFAIITEFIDGYTIEDLTKSLVYKFIDPTTGKQMFDKYTGEYIYDYNITLKFNDREILNFLKGLVRTLRLLHYNDIVHRDIKSANIIFSKVNSTIKYIDFGFACFTNLGSVYACDERVSGTPPYLAPELWTTNLSKISKKDMFNLYKKADVWSLGIVFYEFLLGTLPPEIAESLTISEIKQAVINPNPLIFIPGFEGDTKLIEIVKKMLVKNSKLRSDINTVYLDLENLSK